MDIQPPPATTDEPLNLVELLASSSPETSLPDTPQTRSYLAHLTSLTLPNLINEPALLASESSTLASELTNLCHAQYPTFLSLHTASVALSSSFDSFATSLSSLIDDAVPVLEQECRSFAASTKEIQAERRKVTTVLEQHDKLLDILEIPQLIDTCVRNGYYQEALDLNTHTASLVARFPNIPVIRAIEAEVAASINQMHSQLLQLLQDPAKLPALFKAVNFLRRMGVLEEPELALVFLTSRGLHMSSLFEAIERERTMDVTRFLRRWIDLWREGVYDIVTQFTSIFLDRPASSTSTTPTPARDLSPFLMSFTHTLVQNLLATLTKTLPTITDAASLSSILTQLSYCASSFARIGLDFRSLVPPIFERVVLDNITKSFEETTNAFEAKIVEQQGKKGKPSTWLVVPDAVADPPLLSLASLSPTTAHIPSSALSSYAPLAVLVNGYLTALNSLRLLAPTSLSSPLLNSLDSCLSSGSTALLQYAQHSLNRHRTSFDLGEAEDLERERAVLIGIASAWVYLVLFVRRALVEGVYGKKMSGKGGAGGIMGEWKSWAVSVGRGDLLASGLQSVEADVALPEGNGDGAD